MADKRKYKVYLVKAMNKCNDIIYSTIFVQYKVAKIHTLY